MKILFTFPSQINKGLSFPRTWRNKKNFSLLWLSGFTDKFQNTLGEKLLPVSPYRQAAAFSRVAGLQNDCNFHHPLIKSDTHMTGRWGETQVPFQFVRKVERHCQGKQERDRDHVVWKDQQWWGRSTPSNRGSPGTPRTSCPIKSHTAAQWRQREGPSHASLGLLTELKKMKTAVSN